MKYSFSRKFSKLYTKAPLKIKSSFDRRLLLFFENKFHPLLNNHAFAGKYSGYRSINVTGDWRAIYREFGNELIYFDLLDTQSNLYG